MVHGSGTASMTRQLTCQSCQGTIVVDEAANSCPFCGLALPPREQVRRKKRKKKQVTAGPRKGTLWAIIGGAAGLVLMLVACGGLLVYRAHRGGSASAG